MTIVLRPATIVLMLLAVAIGIAVPLSMQPVSLAQAKTAICYRVVALSPVATTTTLVVVAESTEPCKIWVSEVSDGRQF